MKSNKQILKDSLPSFTVTIVILAIIFVFRPPFLLLLQGLVAFTLIRSWYKFYKLDFPDGFLWGMVLEVISLLAILLPIYFFYKYFGANGLWSLVVVVLFISGVILWRARHTFIDLIRDIEKKHFGETREERRERLKKNE